MHSCTKPRCDRCLMHRELCLCAEVPSLPTRTRLSLLMHAQERDKPSNTGRLALLCLPNSEVRYRGLRDGTPLSTDGLVDESHESWMLYLSPESEEITEERVARLSKPVRLIVPDGTWSQASRLGAKLVKQVPGIKHMRLKATKPSEYLLRAEHDPNGMATFEAIARTMGMLEGQRVQVEMEQLFCKMRDRVLYTRGKLAAHEVFGGLPNQK